MTLIEIPEVHPREIPYTIRAIWVDGYDVGTIMEYRYYIQEGEEKVPLFGSRIRLRDGHEMITNQPPSVVAKLVNDALKAEEAAACGPVANYTTTVPSDQVTEVVEWLQGSLSGTPGSAAAPGTTNIIFQGSGVGGNA